MKSPTVAPHYRQGDVLLQRVDSLPKKGLTKVPRTDGKIVVALGSSNGNPHYIDEKGSELLRDGDGNQKLVLAGVPIKGTFPIADENKLRIVVDHPKLGEIAFAHADVTKANGQARISGRFSILKHAEHTDQAVRAGNYNHVPQRGFNRGEIRRVQD
jgi:hypothetical protein